MSAHVLLNLLNDLGKGDEMRCLSSIFLFSATILINQKYKGTNIRLYLSYDIKITLNSNFLNKNVILLSLCTQSCYGRHDVSRKSVNH